MRHSQRNVAPQFLFGPLGISPARVDLDHPPGGPIHPERNAQAFDGRLGAEDRRHFVAEHLVGEIVAVDSWASCLVPYAAFYLRTEEIWSREPGNTEKKLRTRLSMATRAFSGSRAAPVARSSLANCELLDTMIERVDNVQRAVAVDGQAVRGIELARLCPFFAETDSELAALAELLHATAD